MNLLPSQKLDQYVAGEATGNSTISPLGAVSVGLTLSEVPLTPYPTKAQMDSASATFTGYVPKAVTWLPPSLNDSGAIEAVGTVPNWRPTDSATPNEIFQAYVFNALGDLLFVGNFDNAPLPMGGNLDVILLTLRYSPTNNMAGIQVI